MVLIAVYWFQPGGAHSLCVYSSREIFGRTIARFADRFARSSSHQVSLARSLATLYARLSLSSSSTLFHRFFVCSFDLSPSPSRVMNRYPWRHARQSAATRALNQGSSRSKPRPHDRSFDRTGYSNYQYIRTYISIYTYVYMYVCTFSRVCARIMCTMHRHDIQWYTRFILLIRAYSFSVGHFPRVEEEQRIDPDAVHHPWGRDDVRIGGG